MNRQELSRYIKRTLKDRKITYREFTRLTEKYVPGGVGRQSLTHWINGKHLPNMLTMSMIYFKADPAEWLFDFARTVMLAVVNIHMNEEEGDCGETQKE